jgi:hypothetical protein
MRLLEIATVNGSDPKISYDILGGVSEWAREGGKERGGWVRQGEEEACAIRVLENLVSPNPKLGLGFRGI